MRSLVLVRHYTPDQTLGHLLLLENHQLIWQCRTLELPWRGNGRKISCIPEGRYPVTKRISQRFAEHLHVQDVPERNWILVHAGNFVTQIEGCILVGREHKDINGDRRLDVTHSRATLGQLLSLMPEFTTLTIVSAHE